MEIEFAFRDEMVNIFAMTHGKFGADNNIQILICKKKPLPDNRLGPFLLDCKKSLPVYKLSDTGIDYQTRIYSRKLDLRYIAYVDCQIEVKIEYKLFEMLSNHKYFSIWDPSAPMKYFEGFIKGYLVLLRVYEIIDIISDNYLDKGRKGRNFYYKLNEPYLTEISKPVIDDVCFESLKRNLFILLKNSNYYNGIV